MTILQRLRCTLTDHPDTEDIERTTSIDTVCTRCNAIIDRERTYEYQARNALESLGFRHEATSYEPVGKVERDGSVVRPGDYLAYTKPSGFPGLQNYRSGKIKYLYRKRGLKTEYVHAAVLENQWKMIDERRWVGRRDGQEGDAPTPSGLRMS